MLEMADDVISSDIVPIILSTRQEYFVTSSQDVLIEGQSEYDIPYRSIGRTLRDLKVIDSDNNRKDLNLFNIDDIQSLSQNQGLNGFYFKGDKIIVVSPTSIDGLSLELWWLMQPSKLAITTDSALISSINGDVITVLNLPDNLYIGAEIDFIKGKQGNTTYDFDVRIINIVGNQITFSTGTVPDSLIVGDVISLAMTTPYIQLPDVCYRLLETKTCVSILQSISDFEGAELLNKGVDKEEKNLKVMLEPRIKGEQTKIINRNGLIRNRRSRYIGR